MSQIITVNKNLLIVRLEKPDDNFALAERLNRYVGEGQSVVIRSLALCCEKAAVRSIDVALDKGEKFVTFPLLRDRTAGEPALVAPMAAASGTDFVLSNFVIPPGWALRVSTIGDPGPGSTLQCLFGQGRGF